MEAVPAQSRLLVAWFCPWAQRAWLVAGISNRNAASAVRPDLRIDIVNDDDSIVLDTDHGGNGSRYHTIRAAPDGVSRCMLKGPMLGSHSVPALAPANGEMISGDSIAISKYIWENGCIAGLDFDAGDASEVLANKWGDLISRPFYGSIMNKDDAAETHFDELMENICSFGEYIAGPYFFGDTPSLVDTAVLPFIYRILVLTLYQTYRSSEIQESKLNLTDIDACIPASGLKQQAGLRAVTAWLRHCMDTPWFQATLPEDSCGMPTCYSEKLRDVYAVYAEGIGLQSIPYSAPSGIVE